MFVARQHESGVWIPQGGVRVGDWITVETDGFSPWVVARFDDRQGEATLLEVLAADRRVQQSKVFKGITGLMAIPPAKPDGCARGAKPPLVIDLREFFPGLADQVCLKADGTRARFFVGNDVGYPIKLTFPDRGVRLVDVQPDRGNVLTVLADVALRAGGENVFVLQGGQRIEVELDLGVLGSDITVAGEIDLAYSLLSFGGTALQTVVPIHPEKITSDKRRQELIKLYGRLIDCAARQAGKLMRTVDAAVAEPSTSSALAVQKQFVAAVGACASEFSDFLVGVLIDPTKWMAKAGERYAIRAVTNRLPALVAKRLTAAVGVWENAGAASGMLLGLLRAAADGGLGPRPLYLREPGSVAAGGTSCPVVERDITHGGRLSPYRLFCPTN